MKFVMIQRNANRFDAVLTDAEGSQIGEGAVERHGKNACTWWVQKWNAKEKRDVTIEGEAVDIAAAERAIGKATGIKQVHRMVRKGGKLYPATLPATATKSKTKPSKSVCPHCGKPLK